jgi:O-antigen ligase
MSGTRGNLITTTTPGAALPEGRPWTHWMANASQGYTAVRPLGSWQAAFLLQVFVVAAFALPTDTVVKVIGAQGYVASLVAMLMLAAWVLTAIFGFHDPLHTRHPIRGALAAMWIASLLSYAAMPFYSPGQMQQLGALRWMMLWAGVAGVVLVTAEHLRADRDVLRVIRVVVWGGAFSGTVALLQFWAGWDLKPLLRQVLVGFERNGDYSGFQARGALTRVTGMANHPIELAVVAGMLLPLAIWLALYDLEQRSAMRRWAPVALIAMCIPMSVSRSGILAAASSVALLVVALPPLERARVILWTPVAVVAVFASTPGYLRTMYALFTAGSSDASVTNRLDNYPRVMAALEQRTWLGQGGGTDIQVNLTKVLDNQYLKSAVELGVIGVLALVLYMVVPVIAMVDTLNRTRDPRFRALCGALAGSALAAAVSSYTFDSFSFAQFASVHALVVGLCGTCWLSARRPNPHEAS